MPVKSEAATLAPGVPATFDLTQSLPTLPLRSPRLVTLNNSLSRREGLPVTSLCSWDISSFYSVSRTVATK